jgi:hypothetical protein
MRESGLSVGFWQSKVKVRTRHLTETGQPAMKPCDYPVPATLYKYFPPERTHLLQDGRVRFSQRTVFADDHELQPDFASFGTEGEILRFVLLGRFLFDTGGLPLNVIVRLIAENPKHQANALAVAVQNTKSIDRIGVFCLTEANDREQMWSEYAAEGTGFVFAFDTTHPDFRQWVSNPGRLGKVEYSDQPFGSFLGAMENEGAGTLFRKRMRYSFEAEWRSIRMLHRLERRGLDVYLGAFSPASVREIIIRPTCAVEEQLRQVVENDARYRHVPISVQILTDS